MLLAVKSEEDEVNFGRFLFMPCATEVPLDSLLQVLLVQVGQGVRGFQGFQAHHLSHEVLNFPKEKKKGYVFFSQK